MQYRNCYEDPKLKVTLLCQTKTSFEQLKDKQNKKNTSKLHRPQGLMVKLYSLCEKLKMPTEKNQVFLHILNLSNEAKNQQEKDRTMFFITLKSTCKNSGILRNNNFIQNHQLRVARFLTRPFACSSQYTYMYFSLSLMVTSWCEGKR